MWEAADRAEWDRQSALMWLLASMNRPQDASPLPWNTFHPYEQQPAEDNTPNMSREDWRTMSQRFTRSLRRGR